MQRRPLKLRTRESSDHKGTFGRVLLVGGSRGMAGSISLSSIAALHTGSGLVAAAVPDPVLETVAGFHAALMTIAMPAQDGCFSVGAWSPLKGLISRQDAIGVGPGMTTNEGSVAIVDGLLRQRQTPVVFDADALNVISEHRLFDDEAIVRTEGDAAVVLTPHPGELSRLTGVPASDGDEQLAAAQRMADRLGITIVVKGGPTRVTDGCAPDAPGRTFVNSTGNPAMATAGCGDVLTGVITSLLGQGLSGWDAARLGVWIHGRAGDVAASAISAAGMTAAHLVETLAIVADEMAE
ncbi:NAD(P)H-hydrate dehydratase [Aporhodopirellula aestuarii]|uniref:ADP-dependent (S)-NAD(P)H-hydrate dehydratase n=1 Tax=Aporhodopirellula aestuarii TaxID=2950107 RepID=A0ABT0UC04_9BACT|nr:NAD(P)H-hydrate dehydratase [Aporhodopirellula aestuarii]MCM2374533.1 NAD(P)H-hydrate dehydratase [Aporhodopirellula aestuarii]